ncbi:MAG: hypothetical protein U0271_08415 [Polyangiaceae bacterium]
MSRVNLLVLGRGTVGSVFVDLVRARDARPKRGPRLALDAIHTRRATYYDRDGALALGAPLDPYKRVSALAAIGPAVLVDLTAAPEMGELYLHALRQGVSVVTANKLPLVRRELPLERLLDVAEESGATLKYETTVGADLPVLQPILDRLASGDRVVKIEGSLSGSLAFLSSMLNGGSSFERALEEARALGFTEPDPREDLSGRDVARKAVILARTIGVSVADGAGRREPCLEDVALEPFPVGPPQTAGLVPNALAYLATIDVLARTPIRVGPALVPHHHPAASLASAESFVAITTARSRVPLVVRGPGAGALATASGVLADVVTAARWSFSR